MVKHGLISRDTLDFSVKHMESYIASQSILGRIFNYGTITLQGSGSTKYKIRGISKPLEFRDSVYDMIKVSNNI